MLEGLNREQREAVTATEGSILLVAGAGSGKTRVLTARIAHLVAEHGVDPAHILAFTFTNKAATEMRARVERMVPNSRKAWIGTFHATCVRILRSEAPLLGYSHRFSIYDADDSRSLLRSIIKDHQADPNQFAPRDVAAAISRLKNALIDPAQAAEEAFNHREEVVAHLYAEYERRLKRNGAFDFDDLIVKTVRLMEEQPEVRDRYGRRFRYVLVDEFQDTNPPQLILIKALSSVHGNLFTVGDDDQSIYSWRGATVENMLHFEEYFPGASILRLTRNYRSTPRILRAANRVISHNRRRRGKELWNEGEEGAAIEVHLASDEEEEALAVRQRVERLREAEGIAHHDVAVLYRTNAQSRALEDALRREGIPYQIAGGTRFYERREVRDVLAYLKAIVNPDDDVAVSRILNVPRRGIGKVTVERLFKAAAERGIPVLTLCADADAVARACGDRSSRRIADFAQTLAQLRELAQSAKAADVVRELLRRVRYEEWLVESDREAGKERCENVEELVNAAETFDNEADEGQLADFLESVALLADVDRLDASGDMVTLMTLHNAKGLEFPAVVITGCEEGLLPHASALAEDEAVEEERRLFYVGMTRAQRWLILTAAAMRRRFGVREDRLSSRFLAELPDDCVEHHDSDGLGFASRRPLPGLLGKGAEDAAWMRPPPAVAPARRDAPGAGPTARAAQAYGRETFARSRARRRARPRASAGHGFEDHEICQETEVRFAPGLRVIHETLGEGVVEEVEGVGELTRLTVWFGERGRKRVLARYARLTIVGEDPGESTPW